MKKQILSPTFLLIVVAILVLAVSQTIRGDDATSPGRYKILSSPSGQYVETYMLDKQTGRLWMLRGQVTDAPYLIACVYQMVNDSTALSPLDEGTQSETTEDRFVIKSAPGSQYAETYVLDKQNGRVWMVRGQVSQGPHLIPCVYQLSSINTALSPLSSFLPKDRFSMTCIAGSSYPETYVNDIETGAIWKMRGQVSKAPFLIPCVYQLVNGETTSSPIERHREIDLLGKTKATVATSANTAASPNQNSEKSAAFWREQLENVKAGKDWKALHGFDSDGNPLVGPPQPPSAAAEETIKFYIKSSQDAAKLNP
ncbi:MAG: hypothetical protein PHY43_10525 [Verrucomicrobiales bacterium]|nr:hypothetical protein [Verrucomicrobiales bacterium]